MWKQREPVFWTELIKILVQLFWIQNRSNQEIISSKA